MTLEAIVQLALTLWANDAVKAVILGLAVDLGGRLLPALGRMGLNSHRLAYLKDAWRFIAPRLGPGLIALAKAVWGSKHPEVVAALAAAQLDTASKPSAR